MDQDSPDTSGLSDLYLGSQHVQDITDETPYLQAIPIEQATGDMEQPTSPGFTDQLHQI